MKAGAALLLVVLSCTPVKPEPDGGTWNSPGPRPSSQMPASVADGLPKNKAGKPILVSGTSGQGELALVYDDSVEDEITWFAECVDRVAACYRTNAGFLGGCVHMIEICPNAKGGRGCCPRQCLDAYRQKLATGVTEDDAVDAVFLEGGCVLRGAP